jgi:hypothetical protein
VGSRINLDAVEGGKKKFLAAAAASTELNLIIRFEVFIVVKICINAEFL